MVSVIIEQLCGAGVSASQVSRAAEKLDEMPSAWRNRALGEVLYSLLDKHFEKVRLAGSVLDDAILTTNKKRDSLVTNCNY